MLAHNKTTFGGYVRATASESNPLMAQLHFVFTDFAPNANKQGVRRSEIDNIVRSSLYMPVKASFDGTAYRGHSGAVPIGPIVSMREENGVLVAEARVWRDEFPDLIEYITAKASKGEKNVNFSWEMFYKDSEIDSDGNEWLNDVVVAGTTLVDVPAYRGRTHLIAMAEQAANEVQAALEARIVVLEQLVETLSQRSEVMTENVEDVTPTVDAEEVVAETEEVVAETTEEVDAVQAELTELRAFKHRVEREAAVAQIVSTRFAKMTEAGVSVTAEQFQAKQDFLVALSDEQFASYVDSLIAFAPAKATSEVHTQGGVIPDPLTGTNNKSINVSALAAKLRSARGAENK